jgi:hypothetical protein
MNLDKDKGGKNAKEWRDAKRQLFSNEKAEPTPNEAAAFNRWSVFDGSYG